MNSQCKSVWALRIAAARNLQTQAAQQFGMRSKEFKDACQLVRDLVARMEAASRVGRT